MKIFNKSIHALQDNLNPIVQEPTYFTVAGNLQHIDSKNNYKLPSGTVLYYSLEEAIRVAKTTPIMVVNTIASNDPFSSFGNNLVAQKSIAVKVMLIGKLSKESAKAIIKRYGETKSIVELAAENFQDTLFYEYIPK